MVAQLLLGVYPLLLL